jgi:acyl carrier protein
LDRPLHNPAAPPEPQTGTDTPVTPWIQSFPPKANLMSNNETPAGIRDILVSVAGVDPSTVTPDKTFAELGLDSMTTLEFIVAAEDRFGMLIPDDDWSRFRTVGDAIQYIDQAAVPAQLRS